MQLTLWRDLTVPMTPPEPLAAGFAVASRKEVSAAAMGELHYNAYQPPARLLSTEDSRDDIQAALDGEYGELMTEASLVVLVRDQPVAVIQTVLRAP